MENDDTIYWATNDFERKMKKEKGVRFFREYRKQLYEDEEKERKLLGEKK